MKIMPCPLNGPRNIEEFVCGGEVILEPDPDATSDDDWSAYLFIHENRAGIVREWWYHVPTSYWFIAERDTVTDEIVDTYPPDDLFGREPRPDAPPATTGSGS